MPSRPQPLSETWYLSNPPTDQNKIAIGFGLATDVFKELRPRIYDRALRTKPKNTHYKGIHNQQIQIQHIEAIYHVFQDQLAPAPTQWMRAALRKLIVAAHTYQRLQKRRVKKADPVPINPDEPESTIYVDSDDDDAAIDNEDLETVESASNDEPTRVNELPRIPSPPPAPAADTAPPPSSKIIVDPLNTPLILHHYTVNKASGTAKLVGVKSTKFLCSLNSSSSSSSSPMVSFNALISEVQQREPGSIRELYLDGWSHPGLALSTKAELNTAIHELLERGVKVARLSTFALPALV